MYKAIRTAICASILVALLAVGASAGKDIYQSKFAHELAQDPKCWRQVTR